MGPEVIALSEAWKLGGAGFAFLLIFVTVVLYLFRTREAERIAYIKELSAREGAFKVELDAARVALTQLHQARLDDARACEKRIVEYQDARLSDSKNMLQIYLGDLEKHRDSLEHVASSNRDVAEAQEAIAKATEALRAEVARLK